MVLLAASAATLPRATSELRLYLHHPPKTLDPLQASETSAETIRLLTCGTLLRVDRRTRQLTPELASSWKVRAGQREIEFTLRPNLKFSDGTPLTAADVVYTMRKLLDPTLHSPLGDRFRGNQGEVLAVAKGPLTVVITTPKPEAQLAAKFDSVPILSEKSPNATAGPYTVSMYKAGSEIELRRNPNYWKRDERGTQLPYVEVVRMRIQSNREIEVLDFERGDIDLISQLSPEQAERLSTKNPGAVVDLGATFDALVFFFNQVPGAALPAQKKLWFQSTAFRKALSLAVNRQDICRIGYRGKAQPGVGPIAPSNQAWFNTALKADPYDPEAALKLLKTGGFTFKDGVLSDAQGNRIEFSVVTNAGNKTHERVLGLLQQDWKRIGIKLNVVTLDFPSVIERITRTYNFEACLLPLTNVSEDPEDQLNIWLSSAANHQWNPNQSTPATPWEKEIDEQIKTLTTSPSQAERKKAMDRVQALAVEHVPFLYLAHPRAMGAVAPGWKLAGAPVFPFLLNGLESARYGRPGGQ